jgi:hypothetical protein
MIEATHCLFEDSSRLRQAGRHQNLQRVPPRLKLLQGLARHAGHFRGDCIYASCIDILERSCNRRTESYFTHPKSQQIVNKNGCRIGVLSWARCRRRKQKQLLLPPVTLQYMIVFLEKIGELRGLPQNRPIHDVVGEMHVLQESKEDIKETSQVIKARKRSPNDPK